MQLARASVAKPMAKPMGARAVVPARVVAVRAQPVSEDESSWTAVVWWWWWMATGRESKRERERERAHCCCSSILPPHTHCAPPFSRDPPCSLRAAQCVRLAAGGRRIGLCALTIRPPRAPNTTGQGAGERHQGGRDRLRRWCRWRVRCGLGQRESPPLPAALPWKREGKTLAACCRAGDEGWRVA